MKHIKKLQLLIMLVSTSIFAQTLTVNSYESYTIMHDMEFDTIYLNHHSTLQVSASATVTANTIVMDYNNTINIINGSCLTAGDITGGTNTQIVGDTSGTLYFNSISSDINLLHDVSDTPCGTLGLKTYKDFKGLPNGIPYTVYDFNGRQLFNGVSGDNKPLPNKHVIIKPQGYKAIKVWRTHF